MATQAERRSTTRRSIVEAAIAAFEQAGSSDVALEVIAQAAGVTKGTIHYHYNNRAGLLAAVAIRLFTEVEARINANGGSEPVAPDRYVHALLTEQASSIGRLLFVIGDELLRLGPLDRTDPYRYLCTRFEQLGINGQPIVVAGAVLQFGRQLAFGLAEPGEIDEMVAALDL